MQIHLLLSSLFLISLAFFCHPAASAAAPRNHREPQDLVRSSCVHARYPNICIRTLSNYAGPADTPKDLAQASVRISLAHARTASKYLKSLIPASPSSSLAGMSHSGSKRLQVALSDCMEQISDSVDDLRRTLKVLQHLRVGTFEAQMSDVETWVSSALTNDDTCLDGFGDVDGKIKTGVNRRITDVARVTSNALYMINRFDESHGRGKPTANTE